MAPGIVLTPVEMMTSVSGHKDGSAEVLMKMEGFSFSQVKQFLQSLKIITR
jgi:hypothetical protein